MVKIEVETRNLDEVAEALHAGAEIIMLDNMSLEAMRKAVAMAKGKALIEASGGITLETLRPVAETGVDIISDVYKRQRQGCGAWSLYCEKHH